MKTYHTLLTFESGRWSIAFGDFDLDVVKDEREDSYEGVKTKIIHTADDQLAVDLAVNDLNQWRA